MWRRRGDGALEVAVVHRPRYDDWTLPKGKLDRGETTRQTAVREVEEETGLRPRLGGEIARIEYRDRNDRPKRVTYFYMEPIEGEFHPNDEVDALRWATLDEAERLLSYPRDRDVIAAVRANPPPL